MPPEDKLSCIWRKNHTEVSFYRKYWWNNIFIASCLCSLFVDPLFLYVPILKDDFKCLMLDPKLKIIVLLLRSLTDFFYLMDIIIRIYRSDSGSIVNRGQHRMDFSFVLKSCVPRIVKTIWASNDIIIDIVALLPFPQVAVFIFFSKMCDLRSLTPIRMVLTNVFAVLQYVPRVLRIYLSSNELKKNLEKDVTKTPIWIKGVLNFCMYTIASHVIGALWYFFAIQRMMICWHFACRKDDGCDNRIFGCHDHHAFRNTTILNDLCPVNVSVNSSDTMLFDFGIFATVLQYGIVGSTNYFKKLLNCFWWGLRNLSSLGSNLQPSADGWENLYTIFISITGLLLFLYLIGNLQTYMQLESTRTENHMQLRQKMKGKDDEIELWLFKKGIPTRLIKDFKLQILEKVKQAAQEDTDTNLDNILPLLPSEVQSHIKEPFDKLKQVPMLREIDEDVLKIICQELEPVRYTENDDIIQKDKPLAKILFIVDGDVSIEEGSSDDSKRGAGQLCGEELLRWPFYSYFPDKTPLATKSVKAIGVVEALALNAQDLQSKYDQSDIAIKETSRQRGMMKKEMETNIDGLIHRKEIPEWFNQSVKSRIMEKIEEQVQNNALYWDKLDWDWDHLVSHLPLDFQNEIKRCMALTKLKKVPMLRRIDEDVLKIICQKLEPVRYTDNNLIIQKGEQLDKMVYIEDGFVSIEERSSNNLRLGAGEFCGQELLRWPFSTDFPNRKPLATESVKAIGVVEALALNAQDLLSMYLESNIKGKEEPRHRRMMKEEIERNIDGLIRRNGIPERLNHNVKSRIMENVEENFQQYDHYWDLLDWDHLVPGLPLDFQKEIISYMPLTKLKQMPAFQYMNDEVMKEICSHLRPMKYNRTDNIIDKGNPIQMLLIVEGSIGQEGWVKDAGEIYGEELLVWPFSTSFPNKVPTAAESPFVSTDVVEALVLTASDMESVATKFRKHFIKNYGKFVRMESAFPYDYSEGDIKKATTNYTCLNNPNEGGYGTVYHPELNGRSVAIKTCNSTTGDPFIQSQRLVHEAFVLSQIDHENVEKLLGCCLETTWPIMVYDRTNALTFVEHFHRNKSKLSLESRMTIAAETAGALAHMHSSSVIHRDVKTANILIDHTTHTVQVTGFGASRLLDEDEGEMEDRVSTLPRTLGYLDPEYLESHMLTKKSDVYSFGVVLVELLTRQESVSSNGSETSLANDFVRSVHEDRLGQILDGEINTDKFSYEMAKKVSELAVTCLRSRGEERPSMEKVAEELEGVVQAIMNRVEHSTVDDNISSASRTSE
ncbi:uncharacterized protein [Malus domestica]|uniref:uncharacterized protein n=2 Tax=Malus TaxID=3749 RepID=UPI001460CB29